MKQRAALVATICLLAACNQTGITAASPLPQGTVSYGCDAGKVIVVTYIGQDEVGIDIDGPERLLAEPTDRGRRYAWPSDGSYHIWEIDRTGTLSYRDGEMGTTTVMMSNCRPA
jgi:hypothetical protein